MAVKTEVIEKVAALMTAAFGLVAALAWNEAIGGLFKVGGPLYFLATYGVWAYAIFVTALAVSMTVWIGRVAAKISKKETDVNPKETK